MQPARLLAAIQAGKHVLTEKPFASNADEAREVRDAAAAAGVTIMEGFHYLYEPHRHHVKRAVGPDSRQCGDVRVT